MGNREIHEKADSLPLRVDSILSNTHYLFESEIDEIRKMCTSLEGGAKEIKFKHNSITCTARLFTVNNQYEGSITTAVYEKGLYILALIFDDKGEQICRLQIPVKNQGDTEDERTLTRVTDNLAQTKIHPFESNAQILEAILQGMEGAIVPLEESTNQPDLLMFTEEERKLLRLALS